MPRRAETLTAPSPSPPTAGGAAGTPKSARSGGSAHPTRRQFSSALGALAPADGIGMCQLAEHRLIRTDHAGAVDDPDVTLPVWLAATLKSLGELSAEERRAAYRHAAGSFIEFVSEADNSGEGAATTVRVEWGPPDARRRIFWQSPDTSLRTVLGEPDPNYLATTTVRVAWATLLALTTPAKEPET